MADLKSKTQQPLINQYGPVTACLMEAQGVDPATLANERPVPDRDGVPVEGAKAYTAERDKSVAPDSGQQVGVQIVDWHTNPVTGYQQTDTQKILADTAVDVIPAGHEQDYSLKSDTPHTQVTQTRGFTTTVVVPGKDGGPIESAVTNRVTGETTFTQSDGSGNMPKVEEGKTSQKLRTIHTKAIGCGPMG